MTRRTLAFVYDSNIDDAAWQAMVAEIVNAAEQSACDYAASVKADEYTLTTFAPTTRVYFPDSEAYDASLAEFEAMVAADLVYQDGGDWWFRPVCPYPGDGANEEWAGFWFWQVGDQWMAVDAEESEDDWFFDCDSDGTSTPTPRTRPIHLVPTFGTLVYRNARGDERTKKLT